MRENTEHPFLCLHVPNLNETEMRIFLSLYYEKTMEKKLLEFEDVT